MNLYLTDEGAFAVLQREKAGSDLFGIKLIGGNSRSVFRGLDKLPGVSNYFIGNDPEKWRTNVPHYSRVERGPLRGH